MKFAVKIMPRAVILDTQGRAVENSLNKIQVFQVQSCRVGKYVEIEIDETSEELGYKKIKEIAEYILFNPLIEQYEVTRLP
jgi:phosphoribosylformylglycinamidine synthase subunit PurS